jgi:hypothetical protein
MAWAEEGLFDEASKYFRNPCAFFSVSQHERDLALLT